MLACCGGVCVGGCFVLVGLIAMFVCCGVFVDCSFFIMGVADCLIVLYISFIGGWVYVVFLVAVCFVICVVWFVGFVGFVIGN